MDSLKDIELRKAELRKQIAAKEAECATLWDQLFEKPSGNTIQTPTQRLLSYANKGAAIFDGAMVGWKLYRHFRPAERTRKKRPFWHFL